MPIYLRPLARRLLGTTGVRLLRNFTGTILHVLRVVEPPHKFRPKGVSAVIWSKNEEWWIEPSMKSVKDLVDEYVLIDASTDRTPDIALEVGRELGIPVKIIKTTTTNMAEVGNLGLNHSKYRWILKWDPDFIMKEEAISLLKKLIEELDEKKRHYLVYWPHVCLNGDLFHQNPKSPLHVEHWLFTYHPKLKYINIGWLEHLKAPLFYMRVDIEKPLSFHLRTVKPPVRLLYRHYWYRARREGVLGKVDLDTYVKQRIIKDYNTSDIEEAANMFLKKYLSGLVKYNKAKYGDYPRILKEYVKRRYEIIL